MPTKPIALAGNRLADLLPPPVEAPDVLVGEPYGDRGIEELPADLIVSPHAERELATKLAEEDGAAPFQRAAEEPAVHDTRPHPPAELVVVREAESGDAASGAADDEIERHRIARAGRA